MPAISLKILIALGAAILLGIGAFFVTRGEESPGPLDGFAQCLKDKGAIFYGAFWCPHCQNQKKMFGKSERLLPYVECSTPDGRQQLPACRDKKVEGYPTWDFADGTRLTGEIPLSRLGELTGCPLRQGESEASPLP